MACAVEEWSMEQIWIAVAAIQSETTQLAEFEDWIVEKGFLPTAVG